MSFLSLEFPTAWPVKIWTVPLYMGKAGPSFLEGNFHSGAGAEGKLYCYLTGWLMEDFLMPWS